MPGMTVLATSDFHGRLPIITKSCDLLLVGGDVCPMEDHSPAYQLRWLDKVFRSWLETTEAGSIIGVAGNHDFVFEKEPGAVAELELPWSYLQDEMAEVGGLRVYGTPWTPNLPRWAFHGGMDNRCGDHFDQIPHGLDILLSHGPMHGYADKLPEYGYVGCKAMAKRVNKIKPRSFVCGHIHEGAGHYRHPHVEHGVFNVAYLDEHYRPAHKVVDVSFPNAESPPMAGPHAQQ